MAFTIASRVRIRRISAARAITVSISVNYPIITTLPFAGKRPATITRVLTDLAATFAGAIIGFYAFVSRAASRHSRTKLFIAKAATIAVIIMILAAKTARANRA